MTRRAAALAFASLLLAAPGAQAQEPTPRTAVASDEPAIGEDVQVVLRDGQVLRGRLVQRSGDAILIDSSGARLSFPTSSVRQLSRPGAPLGEATSVVPPRDTNRTRYLFSPSGFMLKQGEGYVSQTELAATMVAVGAFDWLTLQAGTIIFLIYSPENMPFLFGARVGGGLTDWLHVSAGFSSVIMPTYEDAPAVGFAFGTVTLGSEDLNLSVSAGPPFAMKGSDQRFGDVFGAVSGTWRVGSSIALVTENWFFPIDGELKYVASGAVRFIATNLAVDAGLFKIQGLQVPIPWLGFNWQW